MPPDAFEPGSARDWLRHAKADLALARVTLPKGGLYSTLCFHAQQAAEKAIKAVLVHHGVEVTKIHNIERLIDLLPADVQRTEELVQSARLTPYATMYRYPGEHDEADISPDQYRQLVRLAEQVVDWATGRIAG